MKYIITAGGTGGHIYPAIMLAEKFLTTKDEVLFIASNRNIDKSILNDVSFDVKFYKMNGFSRTFSLGAICKNIINVFYIIFIMLRLIYIFLKFKPNGVIGFGGFITYPVLLMANILRIKTFIHEQNSFPGLVNRKLAKKATKVFYTYEASLKFFNDNCKEKYIYSSNPRIELAKKYKAVKKNFILFLGGSQGAEILNKLALEYAKNPNHEVILVCGTRYYSQYKDFAGQNLTVFEYLNEPLTYISQAAVVVTRAGATTLLECAALDCKIVAIPSPNVVADHQTLNAKELAKFAIIEVLEESRATLSSLEQSIKTVQNKNKQNSVLESINSLAIIVKNIKE